MLADQRTRAVLHREWLVPLPVHHSDLAAALNAAAQRRGEEPGEAGEVTVTADGDGDLVVGYTVEVDRAELDRRAAFFEATIKRVRALAVEWSAIDGPSAVYWREASRILHQTLDGPVDEEPGR